MTASPRQPLLSTAYLPPVQWFSRLAASDVVSIEMWESYHKQTYRNRCVIDAPNGPVVLTIPVEKPDNGSRDIKDIRISDHDDWRNKHWHALESSYFNTPFFEFYQDDFRPFYEKKYEFLTDFNEELIHTCMKLTGISCDIRHTTEFVAPEDVNPATTDDLRFLISPKTPLEQDSGFQRKPYYQVFADRHGFQPNLSIIDLLFNLGPESVFILSPQR